MQKHFKLKTAVSLQRSNMPPADSALQSAKLMLPVRPHSHWGFKSMSNAGLCFLVRGCTGVACIPMPVVLWRSSSFPATASQSTAIGLPARRCMQHLCIPELEKYNLHMTWIKSPRVNKT